MRVLFSLIALVVVAFIVMKLAAKPLQAIAPSPAVAGSAAARTAAQQAADKVQSALQQGAVLRAEEAASR